MCDKKKKDVSTWKNPPKTEMRFLEKAQKKKN